MAIEAAEISHLSDQVSVLVRREVADLSDGVFMESHDAFGRFKRLVDTLGAVYAADAARRSNPDLPGGGLARRQGFGNAGAMVAQVTGETQASALRAIEAGLAFTPDVAAFRVDSEPTNPNTPLPAPSPAAPRYPAVAAAARAGDLSVEAAGIITAGLETIADRVPSEKLHEVERLLVDKAMHLAV